jgi:hypothetical protein
MIRAKDPRQLLMHSCSTSLQQMQDYLARRRRFTKLDVAQLNADWIIAVRSWLAHKDRTNEQMMDDLAAELLLRGIEPRYGAVKQELTDRSAQKKEAERNKAVKEVAREIGEFMREKERPLH